MLAYTASSVLKNPIQNTLMTSKTVSEVKSDGLEREYVLERAKNYRNFFKEFPGANDDIKYIEHNQFLKLYPEYEFIYGPYVDSDKTEFNTTYVLYDKKDNITKLKIIYGSRVIDEFKQNKRLEGNFKHINYESHLSTITDIVNPNCHRGFYIPYQLTEEEKLKIKELYIGCTNVSNVRYNALRNMFVVSLCVNNITISINLSRLLYEIHIAGELLDKNEIISFKNSRTGDIRLDNLTLKNLDIKREILIKECMEKYGLDVIKLENIYASKNFNRFRGVYVYKSENDSPSLYGRKYVKLVKPGTDEQITLMLSRALITVQLNRILSEHETVDHIDRDKTNDNISNLQLLGRQSHSAEDAIRGEVSPINCPICNVEYYPSLNDIWNLKNINIIPVCSKKCRKKLAVIRKNKQMHTIQIPTINHRYYLIDKITREKVYFKSNVYKECIRLSRDSRKNNEMG